MRFLVITKLFFSGQDHIFLPECSKLCDLYVKKFILLFWPCFEEKKKNETKQDSTNTVKEGDTKSHCGSAPIVKMRKKGNQKSPACTPASVWRSVGTERWRASWGCNLLVFLYFIGYQFQLRNGFSFRGKCFFELNYKLLNAITWGPKALHPGL